MLILICQILNSSNKHLLLLYLIWPTHLTPGGVIRDDEDFEEPEENDEDPDRDIDEELAAELNLALGADDVNEDDEEETARMRMMKMHK